MNTFSIALSLFPCLLALYFVLISLFTIYNPLIDMFSTFTLTNNRKSGAPMVTFDIFWPCGLPMHRGDLSPISKLQKCNQRRQETTVDQKPEGARVQLCQAPWCPGRASSQFSWTSVPTPALPSDGKQTFETVAFWPLPASNFHNCKMQKRC